DYYEHVIGIDISESLLEIARAKQSAANLSYICMDAEQIKLSQTIDLIVSENTFYHINDVGALLVYLKCLLRPSGKLMIRDLMSNVPTPATWVSLIVVVQALVPNIRT